MNNERSLAKEITEGFEALKSMRNNEPVAWMQTWENQDGELKHTVNIEQIGKQDIPLYTHPVKELTDEEIEDVYCEVFFFDKGCKPTSLGYEFCRAILRKAQEK